MNSLIPNNKNNERNVPMILDGHQSPMVAEKVKSFYLSVAVVFEAWVKRSSNYHTQRCYRKDVLLFIDFMNIDWPDQSWELLKTTVEDVRAWRTYMDEELDQAPKTLNRRLSSLSNFYTFLRETAANEKLPIMIHNPAHKDFIKRPHVDPITPTEAISALNARKLISMPSGDSLLAYRDRAILKFYLFTAARIRTGCQLAVHDFKNNANDPKISITEKGKGKSKRTIGIHPEAAEAIQEYIDAAGLTSGPLFRPRLNSRSKKLGTTAISVTTMYRLLISYFQQLPNALQEIELADGSTTKRCVYSPHSLRATAATLLLDSGVDIVQVQKLLGHSKVETTQEYDKRRRASKDSASHKLAV